MGLFLSLFAAAVYVLVVRWHYGPGRVTPDGAQYLMATRGMPVVSPYSRRWLAPLLAGAGAPWPILAGVSVIASAGLMYGLTGSVLGAVLYLGMSGLVWFNLTCPVLVDAPAFALALGAALASIRGYPALAVCLAILAGGTKESAPVFAAVWSGSPLLLAGLAGAWWPEDKPGGPGNPFLAVRHNLTDAAAYVLPWGALAVLWPYAVWHGGIGAAWPSILALVLAYGQLTIATDTSRLYQWAAPSVIVLVCAHMPDCGPALACLHVVHPWRHVCAV